MSNYLFNYDHMKYVKQTKKSYESSKMSNLNLKVYDRLQIKLKF